MFLKSLELQGFKSFAGKTKFEFQNGITGIVGPNGSGKSNVSDAIKWVLGEQSAKKLRGGNMQDVIFAGTQNRKPVGFAYVAITFENSDRALPIDYDEVVVSRKVYRSGESEYRINGNSCRLKDIEELFYDTGIGKEGYSLIGQGRIDLLLRGKSEERRELFDEAAGIVKYKKRKAAAIKKLALENENLSHVTDILSELELRVGPLKAQSDKAKKYLDLRDELKKYDCTAFVLRSDESSKELALLDEKIDIASNDLDLANEEYEKSKEDYSKAEAEIEKLNLKQEEIRLKAADTNKILQDDMTNLGLLEGQMTSLESKVLENEDIINSLNRKIPEIKSKLNSLREDREELSIDITNFKNEEKKLEDKREAIKKESLKLEEENDSSNELILNLLEKQSEANMQIARLESKEDNLLKEIEREEELTKEKSLLLDSYESSLKTAEKEFNEINSFEEAAKNKKLLLEEEKNSLKEIENTDRNKLNSLNSGLIQLRSDLNALKAVTERYDGYSEAIKRIMDKKASNSGVRGVVADIIKTDSIYETAIETALGGALQNIVTDTEAKAKELVAFLKSAKAGRATFLPLNAISPRNILKPATYEKYLGFIGIASDLVKVEEDFDKLSKQLLGRTLVVDNIDNALKLAKDNSYSLRIVTLDGEQLNPGGSLTGGSFKHAGNLLSRRRRLEDLKIEIDKKEEEIYNFEKVIEEIKIRRLSIIEELEGADKALVDIGIKKNTAYINLNLAKEKVADLKKNEEAFLILEALKKDLDLTKKDLLKSKEALMSFKENEVNLRQNIIQKKGQVANVSLELETLLTELNDLKVTNAAKLQKDSYLAEEIERLSSDLNNHEEEVCLSEKKKSDYAFDLAQKREEKEAKEKESKTLKLTLEDLEKEEAKVKEDKEKLNESNKLFFSQRESISQNIASLDKELFRLNSKKERVEEGIEALTDYMWKEYEYTYSSAIEFMDDSLTDLTQINKQINLLKDNIRALGNVNVNAIEEFKETNERYTFLSSQHDDLIKATKSLEAVISDLDIGMREQFAEKFKEINAEFAKVFKELFGGGKASVSIEDGADILDADIIVSAQPPGKKLQNMLQLSGGEKALAAIALLFAIQNLKPSPFCLLDEIEAALDDINVRRYASFLGRLVARTQFVVITHRQGTMAAADRLYGITMQEKGVSTLVSVELKRSEE